jgi:hypothetical protein
MIYRKKFITREYVKSHPTWFFVFGDNLMQSGFGGQAKEMRGEPNVIGIPTKHFPSMNAKAFFSDKDYDKLWKILIPIINQIDDLLRNKEIVVFPTEFGTGLSKLNEKAPRLFERLVSNIRYMELDYGVKHID